MWLTRVSWAERIWALPVLTALAPSERYYEAHGRKAKKLTDWARQVVYQLRRWLPDRRLIMVGDSTYATLAFLHACQALRSPVTVITRLRLDAAVYEPTPLYAGRGRPRKKGARLPTPQQRLADPATPWQRLPVVWYNHQLRDIDICPFQAVWYHPGQPVVPIRFVLIRDPLGTFPPQTLLSTDCTLDPLDMFVYFKRRWQMETTFQQVRTHLGVETQRQWSDRAIARTTPCLLGLFSLVTLLADTLLSRHSLTVRSAAWYPKARPTFADALALVRRSLWASLTFQLSAPTPDMVKVPRVLLERFHVLLAYAA